MLLIAGCSTSSNILAVQEKYTYPNGDYAPLGHISAETKYTKLLVAPVMGREEFLNLEQKALASRPGADLIVDYLVSSNVLIVPAAFLPIVTFTTFRLEGTAAQFRELGQQRYRDGNAVPGPAKGQQ
jgi:hypothetical protein